MKQVTFMDRYPVFTQEIAKNDTTYKNIDEIIAYLSEKIEADPIAIYIGIFDHYSYTSGLEVNEIEGFDGIYAIGDSASLMGPEWRAKQGHVAEVMAKNVAYNLFNHFQNIDSKQSYMDHLNILCVMDTGSGAAFVHRSSKGGKMIPMPIVGHWMKKMWGWYCKNSKLGRIPRIPGM